jgi:hypothetical protein
MRMNCSDMLCQWPYLLKVVKTEAKEYDIHLSGVRKDTTSFHAWLPLATLSVINWASPEIWSLNDAYGRSKGYPPGTKGFTPTGGPDWSGIRDSSTEAIWKMFEIALWRLGIKKHKGPEMTKGRMGR